MHLQVLLIIAIIIVAILQIPVGVVGGYDFGEAHLKIKVSAIKYQLLPKKPRKKKRVKKEKKEKNIEEAKKEKKSFSKEQILDLIPIGLSALDKFRKKLNINRLQIYYLVAGEDPVVVARNYAAATGLIANILASLHCVLNIKDKDIRINFDFLEEKSQISAGIDLTIKIWQILFIAAFAGIKFIKIQKKYKDKTETKEERENEN